MCLHTKASQCVLIKSSLHSYQDQKVRNWSKTTQNPINTPSQACLEARTKKKRKEKKEKG